MATIIIKMTTAATIRPINNAQFVLLGPSKKR